MKRARPVGAHLHPGAAQRPGEIQEVRGQLAVARLNRAFVVRLAEPEKAARPKSDPKVAFTAATEAGVVACFYAFLVSRFVYKQLAFSDLPRIFLDAAMNSSPPAVTTGPP